MYENLPSPDCVEVSKSAISDALRHDKPLDGPPAGPGSEMNAYFLFTKAN